MQRKYEIGREFLKWLALVSMTIDHMGVVLYQENPFFRYVGRLAFPLFAYLLVLGVESTKSVKNYFLRLFLFALISQGPFYLAFGVQPWEHLNIFFTLSSGVLLIYFHERNNYMLFLPLAASVILPFDFGIYGLLTVGCFYLLRRNRNLGVVSFLLLNLLFLPVWPFQFLAIFAIPVILLYDDRFGFGKTGKETFYPFWRKYFFYIYYPLHLLVLYLLK